MFRLPHLLAISILKFSIKLYAFAPFNNKAYLYPLYATALLCVLLVFLALSLVFYWLKSEENNSIRVLVVTGVYTSYIVTSMIAVMEAFIKRRHLTAIERLYTQILANMNQDLGRMPKSLNLKLKIISGTSATCFALAFWLRFYEPAVKSLFWYSFLSKQMILVRSWQVIFSLMIASESLKVLSEALQRAGERNQKQTTHSIWMSSTNDEYRLVMTLRTTYDQFYDLSILLNQCFGWSILMISTTSFFEFVWGAYKMFRLIRQEESYSRFATNSCSVTSMLVLMTSMCWYAHQCCEKALRSRCMQVTLTVICINIRLRIIRKLILEMAKENSKNGVFKNMVALASDVSMEKVASLKMAYNQLYKMVNLLNDCFGWSLFTICTSYFIDFITNCYWIFVAKITAGRYEVYILNGGLVVSLVLQLTVICWHCQESETYSKYIGGSIFKLAKPMGNKRYNDLVSEFSLQALHQSFAVTAKEFFRLNLDLLGSMVGAIVTYLVILIQFMFTERNGSKISVPNSYLSGAVADVMLKNQTYKN